MNGHESTVMPAAGTQLAFQPPDIGYRRKRRTFVVRSAHGSATADPSSQFQTTLTFPGLANGRCSCRNSTPRAVGWVAGLCELTSSSKGTLGA